MSLDKPSYVLDSYALLAYFNDEPGCRRVQEVLALAQKDQRRVLMCLINLGEVLYVTERWRGLTKARQVLALVENLPINLIECDRSLVLDAAHVKAHHSLSYADAFVVATAMRENAVILTGDPEFESVASLVKVEWLSGPLS